MTGLDEFTAACIEALHFTDTGEEDQWPIDAELSPATEDRLRADCHSFWARVWSYVAVTDMTPEQAGHDFWLTRNGHGSGFWDGDWDHTPYAEALDDLSKSYGTFDTYMGDDGLIYA